MKKLDVLAVDDEPINLHIVRTILEAEGHRVAQCVNGHEAMERLQRGEHFDVVVLDVHMPVLNGLETAAAMRRSAATVEIPIVFVSARAGKSDQEAGFAAGGDVYLTKPFRRQDLLRALGEALAMHPPASSPPQTPKE